MYMTTQFLLDKNYSYIKFFKVFSLNIGIKLPTFITGTYTLHPTNG